MKKYPQKFSKKPSAYTCRPVLSTTPRPTGAFATAKPFARTSQSARPAQPAHHAVAPTKSFAKPFVKPPTKPKTTSWGGVANWYDELLEGENGTYQKDVILPNIMRILGQDQLRDKLILDLACGQGYFSRVFAGAGAQVIASDISRELIELAKQNPAQKSLEKAPTAGGVPGTKAPLFLVSPADEISYCKNGTVDAITIILAIQNIENLAGVMTECSRVLKPGGKLLVVMNHPSFRILKNSSWGWDQSASDKTGNAAGRQFRRVDSYMSEAHQTVEMNPGARDPKDRKATVSFHRPLQVYFKAFSKAGLAVTRLDEWISNKESKPGPRAHEENRIRKEIPMFLCLEAEKI